MPENGTPENAEPETPKAFPVHVFVRWEKLAGEEDPFLTVEDNERDALGVDNREAIVAVYKLQHLRKVTAYVHSEPLDADSTAHFQNATP